MRKSTKLEEATHWIINSCDKPTELGAVKLNKILWFSDVHAFRTSGQSITGVTSYVKRKRGPVHPRMLKSLGWLEQAKKIAIKKDVEPYRSAEYLSLCNPAQEHLSADEIRTLTSVTETITKGYTASEISETSHNQAWRIAEEGEDIPLGTSLLLTFSDGIPKPINEWIKNFA